VIGSLVTSFGGWQEALRSLGIALVLAMAGASIFWRYGRRSGWWGRVVLRARLEPKDEDLPLRDFTGYVGKEGVAVTTLRPFGTIEIDGERIDAVSEGGYVDAGRPVIVRRAESSRVVVRNEKEAKRVAELSFFFFTVVLVFAAVVLMIILSFVPIGLWISAVAAGVRVSIVTLIGMRLRRVPPAQIILPLIKAEKAGLERGLTSWRRTTWPAATSTGSSTP